MRAGCTYTSDRFCVSDTVESPLLGMFVMDYSDSDAFLAQEVASSSPARLRFLLIQKAVGLCKVVDGQWRRGAFDDSLQWTLKIQDILTELLEGIRDPNNPLAKSVSDLYVYVLKLFIVAVQAHDVDALSNVREILEIDQETWAMYVANEHRSQSKQSAFALADDDEEPSSFDLSL